MIRHTTREPFNVIEGMGWSEFTFDIGKIYVMRVHRCYEVFEIKIDRPEWGYRISSDDVINVIFLRRGSVDAFAGDDDEAICKDSVFRAFGSV